MNAASAMRVRAAGGRLRAGVVVVVGLVAVAPPAQAGLPAPFPAGAVAREIRVEGLVRVEEGVVRGTMALRPGDALEASATAADLRRLLALGLFEDVALSFLGDPAGDILIVSVVERPLVRNVAVTGNRAIPGERFTDDLVVKPGKLLDRLELARTAERIRARYRAESFPFAEVHPAVSAVAPAEVDVTFEVREGGRVRVRRVTFAGVHGLSEGELRGVMKTRAAGLFGTGKLSPDELARDVDRIAGAYLDAGWLHVKVHPPAVTFDAGRREADVRIRVDEGARYRVGSVRVTGELPGTSAEELGRALALRPGDWFGRAAMTAGAEAIAHRFRDEGRALCAVTPVSTPDEGARTVSVVYEVRPGPVFRVGRIVFSGNRITRDSVLRARLAIAEGDRWSESAIERSRAALERTGWFESVTAASEPGADPEARDLRFVVKEQKTGTIEAAADSTGGENFLTWAIVYDNLFGWGVHLSFRLGGSLHRLEWAARYDDPYFLGTRLGLRLDGLGTTYQLTDFAVERNGASVSAGWSFGRGIAARLRWSIHDLTLTACGFRGCALDDDSVRTLFRDGLVSAVGLFLVQDGTDDAVHPTRGVSSDLSVELADPLLGSRLAFTRLRAVARFFWPLVPGKGPGGGVVLKLFARGALVVSNGTGDVPLSERLFEGGLGSVRGFASRSLGPLARLRTAQPGDPLQLVNVGGTASLVVAAEVEAPLVARAGLRLVAFFDAGNAWGRLSDADVTVLGARPLVRAAAGLGIRWLLPVAALRLELAVPLAKDPLRDEGPAELIFGVGTTF